jgi:uncharacterized protein
MRIIRVGEHRAMPWKNGAGSTVEIAAAPADAGLDSFDWRISMADIIADGPFSQFPGVDRTIAVLSGEGLSLSHPGHERLQVTQTSAPVRFPGDAEAKAMLLGGPVSGLNVMTRRGAFTHTVLRLGGGPPRWLMSAATVALVLSRSAGVVLADENGSGELGSGDAALLDGRTQLVSGGDGACFLIEIFAETGAVWTY